MVVHFGENSQTFSRFFILLLLVTAIFCTFVILLVFKKKQLAHTRKASLHTARQLYGRVGHLISSLFKIGSAVKTVIFKCKYHEFKSTMGHLFFKNRKIQKI